MTNQMMRMGAKWPRVTVFDTETSRHIAKRVNFIGNVFFSDGGDRVAATIENLIPNIIDTLRDASVGPRVQISHVCPFGALQNTRPTIEFVTH